MAEPTDLNEVVADALEAADQVKLKTDAHQARRVKALALRLAGVSYEVIATELGISTSGAQDLVTRTLTRAENRNVEEMRELENARLDRAQSAIWSDVLKGDTKAIDTFLRISGQRARINGLQAPTKIELAVSVQQEMQQALNALEELVLEAEVVKEVVNGDSADDSDAG